MEFFFEMFGGKFQRIGTVAIRNSCTQEYSVVQGIIGTEMGKNDT